MIFILPLWGITRRLKPPKFARGCGRTGSQRKPIFAAVLVAAALLAISYLIPVVRVFFGKSEEAGGCAGDATPAMLVPIIITAAVALILGIMPNAGLHLYDLTALAAEAISSGGGAIV